MMQGDIEIFHIFHKNFTITMDFTDFVPLSPAEQYFYPPKDIYCQGRDQIVPLGEFVELPTFFSFQKETLISRDGVQYSMPATVSRIRGPGIMPYHREMNSSQIIGLVR